MAREPGRPGRRIGAITLRDVARAADVHPGTASRALDPAKQRLVQPATRARVQAAAEALGYRPDVVARSLRSGRTLTVGVVVPDIANPIIAVVVRAIANGLDERGYLPYVVETQDDPGRLARALDSLLGRRVDAVVVSAARLGSRELLEGAAARGTPIVIAMRALPGSGLPSVGSDDLGGGRLAAEHLLGLGHGEILELRGPEDVQSFRDRHLGFSSALAAAGATPLDAGGTAEVPTVAEGRRLMRACLDGAPSLPTALFAHNDAMAIGALEELESRRLVCPRDISVVGYNDAPLSGHMTPPLTTVRFPGAEIGRFAAEMAMQHIDDAERPSAHVSFPPSLVVRASTAPPRAR